MVKWFEVVESFKKLTFKGDWLREGGRGFAWSGIVGRGDWGRVGGFGLSGAGKGGLISTFALRVF